LTALAREQENQPAIVNWFLTLGGSLFDAFLIEYRVMDITGGPPGTQIFPAGPPPTYEDVTAAPGHFDDGSYYAYDNTAGTGWTPPITTALGTHRVEWRWKDNSTAPFANGAEDIEIIASAGGAPAATYITVDDVRNAGLTDDPPSDATILSAILLWQSFIERATRQWFSPKTLTFSLDGTDSDTLHFGIPIISISSLQINNEGSDLDTTLYKTYSGVTYPLDRQNPRIKLIDQFNEERDIFTAPLNENRRLFRKGRQNQLVSGSFGYVEADGSTPLLIQRALTKLVIEKLQQPLVASGAAAPPPLVGGVVIEEWTDGHKIKYAQSGGALKPRPAGLAGITNDQEILGIIRMFRSPIAMATPAHPSFR
jgi:hypothetical protein